MILIIACGNPLREDDGAGQVLGQRLAEAWRQIGRPVRFEAVHQLLPEMAPILAEPQVEEVWFVDARVAGEEKNPTVRFRPLGAGNPSPAVTHQMSAEVLLHLAEELYGRRPPAWLITVPGFCFGHGEGLSDRCRAALNDALTDIFALNGAGVYA